METREHFDITLNGHAVQTDADNGFWCDISLKKVLLPSEYFRPGANTILLKINFREDINLEAIYLLGQFAVSLDSGFAHLHSLPDTVTASDLVGQGLPYYSGSFRYRFATPEELIGKVSTKCLSPRGGQTSTASRSTPPLSSGNRLS